MFDDKQLQEFEKKLEDKGEEKVRTDLLQGVYADPNSPRSKYSLVQNWLAKKESQRQELKRDEELGISRESNTIARSAKNASWWAIAIAIISFLVAVFRR